MSVAIETLLRRLNVRLPAASVAGGWRSHAGWLLALIPLAVTIYLATWIGRVSAGSVVAVSYPWVPSLGMNLAFRLDGLSLLFALLISGIGALVMVYGGAYLAGDPERNRFFLYTGIFMASMLGMVLADNLLLLFVFWELTSISSYLLIGFKHAKEEARHAALQALLITGGGGLAMLAGFLLLAQAGGSFGIGALLSQGDEIAASPLYLPALLLILVGAFTKSAQFPFHFWLPGAMAAPTPVSAYLHSATMVKAGVFLLARLHPALANTAAWTLLVTSAGLVTLVVGAWIAWKQTDLKRILAYSTVSALGMLVFLLGVGTDVALKAMLVMLMAHAVYKGALFMVAGSVDHATGTRDVTNLGGLRRAMPLTAAAAVIAGLSMAGLPPLMGFVSKELLYESALYAPQYAWLLTAAVVMAGALTVTAAALAALRPFAGSVKTPVHHAPGLGLLLGPVVLAALGLGAGLAPKLAGDALIAPALAAVAGAPQTVKLSLWHGVNPMLVLSMVSTAAGALVYVYWPAVQPAAERRFHVPISWRGDYVYSFALDRFLGFATALTRTIQAGYLRRYVRIVVIVLIALAGTALVRSGAPILPPLGWWSDVRLYAAGVALLMLVGATMAVTARSRLATLAALGIVGYGMSLLFLIYSAPDVAMTQIAVETLTVLLFLYVVRRLPRFSQYTSRPARLSDGFIALLAGGVMTAIVLAVVHADRISRVAPYFAENSLALANGRNVVNVILVDFRALDTLGEITVLAAAAIAAYALLRLQFTQQDEDEG